MIDQELAQPSAERGRQGDYDLLLYDYSKHLLSLALISIGGVITLAQSSVGKSIPPKDIGVVVVILALSGVAALSCSAAVLRARQEGKPLGKSASYMQQGAMGLLGVGFGYFLMSWLDNLL
jgi:hypothetical protein